MIGAVVTLCAACGHSVGDDPFTDADADRLIELLPDGMSLGPYRPEPPAWVDQIAELPIDHTPGVRSDYRAGSLAYTRRAIVEPIEARLPDLPAEVREFIDGIAKRIAWSRDSPSYDDLYKLLDSVGEIDDPAVRALEAYAMLPQFGNEDRYWASAEIAGILPGGRRGEVADEIPPLLLGVLRYELLRRMPSALEGAFSKADIARANFESYEQMILDPPADVFERRFVFWRMVEAIDDTDMPWPQAGEAVSWLLTTPGVDPWMAHIAAGQFAHNIAWKIRGTGFAHTVGDSQWDGFRGWLRVAERHLTYAHNLAPDRPDAAGDMVGVARLLDRLGRRPAAYWFDRATEAEMDQPQAHIEMSYDLEPRWGGSYEAMEALGRRAAETNRFETTAPLFHLEAFRRIYENMNDRAAFARFLSSAGRFAAVRDTLERLIDEPAHAHDRSEFRTILAVFAWFVGDEDLALQTALELGESTFDREVARQYFVTWRDIVYPIVASRHRLMSGLMFRPTAFSGDAGELSAEWEAVAAQIRADEESDELALRVALDRAAALGFAAAIGSGERIRIPVDEHLSGWRFFHGGIWEAVESASPGERGSVREVDQLRQSGGGGWGTHRLAVRAGPWRRVAWFDHVFARPGVGESRVVDLTFALNGPDETVAEVGVAQQLRPAVGNYDHHFVFTLARPAYRDSVWTSTTSLPRTIGKSVGNQRTGQPGGPSWLRSELLCRGEHKYELRAYWNALDSTPELSQYQRFQNRPSMPFAGRLGVVARAGEPGLDSVEFVDIEFWSEISVP